MKKTLKILILLTLSLSLFLQGCRKEKDADGEDRPAVNNQVQNYHSSMEYAYSTSVNEEILKTDLASEYLILANKSHPLGETYVPTELVTLTCPTNYGKTVELNRRAAEALYLMLGEMNAAGVTDISVTSGYRSYAYQVMTFNSHWQKEQQGKISTAAYACLGADYIQRNYIDRGLNSLSPADAKTVALSYSAYPGTSEHQTGLCIDFVTIQEYEEVKEVLTLAFENTPAFAWLSNNAYRFGFILRYPEGKEDITGYTYEPWHYRFVGREAATDIHFGKITLEQYLGK